MEEYTDVDACLDHINELYHRIDELVAAGNHLARVLKDSGEVYVVKSGIVWPKYSNATAITALKLWGDSKEYNA